MFGCKRTQLIQVPFPYTFLFILIGSICVEYVRPPKEIYHFFSQRDDVAIRREAQSVFLIVQYRFLMKPRPFEWTNST